MLVFEMVGDIEQVTHVPADIFGRTARFQGVVPQEGKYGRRAWWFPINRKAGIKMQNAFATNNYAKACLKVAEFAAYWDRFVDKLNRARHLIPTVHEWCLVCHTGAWERGSQKRWTGQHEKAFIPAVIMPIYPLASEVPPEHTRAMRETFRADGVMLHKDCFQVPQLGIDDDGLVLLDIEETPKRTVL